VEQMAWKRRAKGHNLKKTGATIFKKTSRKGIKGEEKFLSAQHGGGQVWWAPGREKESYSVWGFPSKGRKGRRGRKRGNNEQPERVERTG